MNYTVSRSYSGNSKHGHFYTKAVNCSTKSWFFEINEISKFFRMALNMTTLNFHSFLYQMPTVDYYVVFI